MKRILLLSAALLLAAAPALAADTTRPTVGSVSPTQAGLNQTVMLTAPVSDSESGITSCRLYVENVDVAAMSIVGGNATIAWSFDQVGVYTVFVFCRDGANNFNSGMSVGVSVVANTSSGDHSPPSIGAVTPTTASSDVSVTYSAQVSDTGSGVSSCQLLVNGFNAGNMTIANGTASLPRTFDNGGGNDLQVQCVDHNGNSGVGALTRITINDTVVKPVVSTGLVKIACPAGADATNPCKAVYYRSADGKRHAFTNSKIYFTWYADFSGVVEISSTELASLPLGKPVPYKPGSRLVKFTTVNKVYAVAKAGQLRWITSEAIASSLYGANWNTKIDDIPDTSYLDYSFGADIVQASGFSPSAEAAAAPTIEQNL